MASHYLAIFGVLWSNASGDMTYLICHATTIEHMIEGTYGVMGWSTSLYVTTLTSLLAIGIVGVEIRF